MFVMVGVGLLWVLRPVIAILAASLALAYVLDPLVDWMERRGMSREGGIGVLFVTSTAAAVLCVLGLIPALIDEFAQIEARVSELSALRDTVSQALESQEAPEESLKETAERFLNDPRAALSSSETLGQIKHVGGTWLVEQLPQITERAAAFASGLLTQGLGLLSAIVNLTLLPIFVFYLLRDWDRLVARAGELIPPRFRPQVTRVAREVDTRLSAFVRGQITVCLALSVLYSLGLLLVGIDLAVPIGVTSGLLFIIPYFGTAVGIVLSLLLGLIEFGIGGELLAVLAVFGIVQAIEGWLLTPYIVGDQVGLPPLVVMIALIVGGSLMGIWGMLVAIPLTAVLAVFASEWLTLYRSSHAFLGDDPQP